MLDLRKNKKLGPAFKPACTPAKVGLFFFLKVQTEYVYIYIYIYSDNKKKKHVHTQTNGRHIKKEKNQAISRRQAWVQVPQSQNF